MQLTMQDELRKEAEELLESVMADPTKLLPKIESFLSEVLRLYPIAPFISRQIYEPVTLGDIHLDQHVSRRLYFTMNETLISKHGKVM